MGRHGVQFLVVCLAACSGGGGSSSNSQPPSGGPPLTAAPSTPASELSDADASTFCDWASQRVAVSDVCRNQGVAMAQKTDGTLQERRDTCASAEQQCRQDLGSALAKQCREEWLSETCKATADELSQCMANLVQNYETAFSSVPECSLLELDSMPTLPDVAKLFVGCEAAKAKCPPLFAPNEDDPTPDPATPAVIQRCQEACDAYTASCGTPCNDNCNISRLVYGEECDVQGERFYACSKTASFDCSKEDLTLATQGCNLPKSDYVTCYALEGVKCKREPALDTQCEDKPGTPFATRCVSDAVPADCVPALGTYHCCPTE